MFPRANNWLTEPFVLQPKYKSIPFHIFSTIDYQEKIGLQFVKNKIKESKLKKSLLTDQKRENVLIQDQKQLQLFQSFLSQKVKFTV